jgi:hypothetical protein
MITTCPTPGPTVAATGRAGPTPAAGPRTAPGRPVAPGGPHNRPPAPRAAPSTVATRCDATRLPNPAGPPSAAPPPAASPAAAKVAAALTPQARARGVVTAGELAAAVAAPRCDPVPVAVPAAPPPRATVDDDFGPPVDFRASQAVTRAECERAAREHKWVGLATPAAWLAALERDEGRHQTALALLRKENWGLYERQRMLERDVQQLWVSVLDLQETLRRAVRGDDSQAALFGLICDKEIPR